MPFALVRIDDRLIHGQVTVAWGGWLDPDRIVLANDEVASCDWRCELYDDEDTLGAAVSIVSVEGFGQALADGTWEGERVLLVVGSPADLLSLVKAGLDVPSANVGGMHHAEGKRELLPYVFVDEDDVRAMREIMDLGTELEARDVPQAQPHDLRDLLKAFDEE